MKSYGVKFSDGSVEYVQAVTPQNAATLARAKMIGRFPGYEGRVVWMEKAHPGEKLSCGPASATKGHGFLNLFIDANGNIKAGGIYPTKAVADIIAQPSRYDCVPIDWTPCRTPLETHRELKQRQDDVNRGAVFASVTPDEKVKESHFRGSFELFIEP